MGTAAAQTAIKGPIRLVVPFGAGTSTDTLARVLSESIASETGQTVIVENKPGGEGIIGAQSVANAAPGGTTVLISSNSTQVLNVHLYRKLPYDPIKDFVAVRGLAQTSMGVAVNAASPWRTVGELLAAARKDQGKLSFASATAVTRLAGEMFKQQAGIQLLNVPYKSNSMSVNALLGREIDVIFVDPVQVLPHTRPEPKLRLLAVTGTERNAAFPDIPTVKESGLADYTISFWYGAWMPAGTPREVATRMSEILAKSMKTAAARSLFATSGWESLDIAGDAFSKFQGDEILRIGRVIKAAGIEPQ